MILTDFPNPLSDRSHLAQILVDATLTYEVESHEHWARNSTVVPVKGCSKQRCRNGRKKPFLGRFECVENTFHPFDWIDNPGHCIVDHKWPSQAPNVTQAAQLCKIRLVATT